MDRCLHRSAAAVWNEQNKKHSTQNNSAAPSSPLSDIYASDTVAALTSEIAPSSEAFGVNIDLAVPDLKVAITVAIMNFHTRLLPRLLPTKSINQPEIQYTKESKSMIWQTMKLLVVVFSTSTPSLSLLPTS